MKVCVYLCQISYLSIADFHSLCQNIKHPLSQIQFMISNVVPNTRYIIACIHYTIAQSCYISAKFTLFLHAHIHTYATSVHIHSNTYARHITINRECVHACTIVVESLSCGGLSLVWLFADTDSDFIQLFFYLSGINNAHNTFSAKRVVIDTLSESTTPTTAAKIKIPFRTQIVFA